MCENKDGMKFRMGSVDIKESETKNVCGYKKKKEKKREKKLVKKKNVVNRVGLVVYSKL